MHFKALKEYVLFRLTQNKDHKTAPYHFENSFRQELQHATTHEEAVILLLSLVTHMLPTFFDDLIKVLHPEGGELPQYGGVRSEHRRNFIPTGETLQYILAGDKVDQRLGIQKYFLPDHWFYKEGILWLSQPDEGETFMSGKLIMPFEVVQLLSYGSRPKPKFGTDFPAQEISTSLQWEDLVLEKQAFEQINHIKLWLRHQQQLQSIYGENRHLLPGFRALFYGPSGTGKSLTGALLGQGYTMNEYVEKRRPVYRIDLSQVVSKYIGETEKNLEKIFKMAENKEWILLFDEADALFGKRSQTKSSHDRYANQEVSYLLQRIERFNGLAILTTNFKSNMDEAFLRRFNSIVKFNKPSVEERLKLWMKIIPASIRPDESILTQLAQHYELTGAQIASIAAHASLHSLQAGEKILSKEELLQAIRHEFLKMEINFTPIPNA